MSVITYYLSIYNSESVCKVTLKMMMYHPGLVPSDDIGIQLHFLCQKDRTIYEEESVLFRYKCTYNYRLLIVRSSARGISVNYVTYHYFGKVYFDKYLKIVNKNGFIFWFTAKNEVGSFLIISSRAHG